MSSKEYKGTYRLPEGVPFDGGVAGKGGVTGEVRKSGGWIIIVNGYVARDGVPERIDDEIYRSQSTAQYFMDKGERIR